MYYRWCLIYKMVWAIVKVHKVHLPTPESAVSNPSAVSADDKVTKPLSARYWTMVLSSNPRASPIKQSNAIALHMFDIP